MGHGPEWNNQGPAAVVELDFTAHDLPITSLQMTSTPDSILERAARWGIDTEYQDAFGRVQAADPQAISQLLHALSAEREPPPRILPRTIVLRQGGSHDVRVDAPAGVALRWEIGAVRTVANGGGSAPRLLLP